MNDAISPNRHLYKCPRCSTDSDRRFANIDALASHLKEEHDQQTSSQPTSPTAALLSTVPLSPRRSPTDRSNGKLDIEWAWPSEGLNRKANDLERLLSEMSKHAAFLDRRAEDEVTAVGRLTDELTKVRKRNWSLTETLRQAQNEVRQLRRALTEREIDAVVKEQCEKMVQQIAELKTDVESKRGALSRADWSAQRMREEKEQLEDQIKGLVAQVQFYFEQAESFQMQLEQREKSAEQLRDFLLQQSHRQLAARKNVNQYIGNLEAQLKNAKQNGFLTDQQTQQQRSNPFLSDRFEDPRVIQFNATESTYFDQHLHQVTDDKFTTEISSVIHDDYEEREVLLPSVIRKQQTVKIWDDDTSLVLLLVFRYLDVQDLVRVSGVCRQWRDVSRHPSLWRHVSLDEDSVHSKVLCQLSTFCSETQSLHLHNLGYLLEPAQAGEDVRSYRQRINGSYEEGLQKFLISCSKHIRKISITDCNIVFTHRSLWVISCHCPNLTDLEYVSDFFPATAESLWSLAQGCPYIKALRVPPICLSETEAKFTDKCLAVISQSWSQLREIGIGGPSLTLTGLQKFFSGCPRLQQIELNRLCAWTESVVATLCKAGLKGLERLDVAYTRIEPDALKYLLGACPRLQHISLNVGISDYFKDVKNRTNIGQFKEHMDQLRVLACEGPMAGILHLRDDLG